MRIVNPPAIDVSDANATAGDVLSPKTFYAGESEERKVGTITQATDLSSVDADLVTGNIKTGITIFGVLGSDDVQDISEGDSLVGEVKEGKTFFSITGGKKTGTLPTKTLSSGSKTVEAGYYAATTLDAVDGDLVSGSIKSGVTIFGVAGSVNVQDISDSDAVVSDVGLGKTFYSVTGTRKTGTHECADPAFDDSEEQAPSYSYGNKTHHGEQDILTGGETKTLRTVNITCTGGATLVAMTGGMCFVQPADTDKVKMQLLIGGVQKAESAYFPVYASGSAILVGYDEDVAGEEITCILRVHNYDASPLSTYAEWSGWGLGACSVKA